MHNILVVDDSPNLLEMISRVYTRRDFLISGAQSREDLFLTMARMRPDLILMDVILERGDGRALCKEIKSIDEFKSIPVILMSGDATRLENHQEVFADDIMEKPFNTETILLKVKSFLGSKIVGQRR